MKKLPKDFADRLEFASLSEEERERILKKAYEHVEAEYKRKAEEAFLDTAIAHEKRKRIPAEQFVDVLIDLPGHAVRLLLDGVEFIHGFTYRVPQSQAASMREQMQNCWQHEDEVGGANRHFYRKPRELKLGPNSTNVSNSRLLGV